MRGRAGWVRAGGWEGGALASPRARPAFAEGPWQGMSMRTDTHTDAGTHAHTHAHTGTLTRTHTDTHSHTLIHHAHSHTHSHIQLTQTRAEGMHARGRGCGPKGETTRRGGSGALM